MILLEFTKFFEHQFWICFFFLFIVCIWINSIEFFTKIIETNLFLCVFKAFFNALCLLLMTYKYYCQQEFLNYSKLKICFVNSDYSIVGTATTTKEQKINNNFTRFNNNNNFSIDIISSRECSIHLSYTEDRRESSESIQPINTIQWVYIYLNEQTNKSVSSEFIYYIIS